MHSAVLQNKKYIQFAEKNSVEVVTLSRIETGIEKGDRKAARYKAKDPQGKPVEYLVKLPGLTVEDVLALNRSPAVRYNHSGKIPYTSIVDPYTLKEMKSWVGGQSAKTVMEGVREARRELTRKHGASASREDFRAVRKGEVEVRAALERKGFHKALSLLEKLGRKSQAWPKALRDRLQSAREGVLEAARAELESIRSLAASDPDRAKRSLRSLARELRGTDLEGEAAKLLESLG